MLGLFLAVGLALFGLEVSQAVKRGRDFDRFLTVRGLSERTVKATSGTWPLRFASDAEDLPKLRSRLDAHRALVLEYLKDEGLPAAEVSFGLPEITDRNELPPKEAPRLPRYKAVMTLVVRSSDVDRLKKAGQDIGALLEKGVTLASGEGGTGPSLPSTG